MSWDVSLTDDRGHREGEWNYTHNTSKMIYATLSDDNDYVLAERETWWDRLSGMGGPEGAAYLDRIIRGLLADPDRYRAMNPTNNWGNYDQLVGVLTEMRGAVPEWPTSWEAGDRR